MVGRSKKCIERGIPQMRFLPYCISIWFLHSSSLFLAPSKHSFPLYLKHMAWTANIDKRCWILTETKIFPIITQPLVWCHTLKVMIAGGKGLREELAMCTRTAERTRTKHKKKADENSCFLSCCILYIEISFQLWFEARSLYAYCLGWRPSWDKRFQWFFPLSQNIQVYAFCNK